MNDDLKQFRDWWLKHRPFVPAEKNGLSHVADTHGVVLYRKEPYQVELFNVKPNSVIPPHIHPNVDSYEVYISGDVSFFCNNKWYEDLKVGWYLRVLPTEWHEAKFGERGGCFLSIQKWMNGAEPRFIGDDWDGVNESKSYQESKN
jgi:quercetin dioxygenase-like cupin family protein